MYTAAAAAKPTTTYVRLAHPSGLLLHPTLMLLSEVVVVLVVWQGPTLKLMERGDYV